MNASSPDRDFVPQQGARADEDWNFSWARPDASSGLHPYPAKFIGEIPRRFIQEYPPSWGTAVLDPFCGSGTTLHEAQTVGIPSIGIDVNPIATMFARVRTSPLPEGAARLASAVLRAATLDESTAVPPIPRLDHWFMPQVQLEIARLASAIAERGEEATEVLRLALSSIIVRVSNQDSDTRYAAVKKSLAPGDVYRYFERAVSRSIVALRERTSGNATARIIEADVLDVSPDHIGRPVGLVVTSPPYPNAYEYWLYHKYRMWWLGFDPLAVKKREIGARAHFYSGARRRAEQDFEHQMSVVMRLIDSVLVEGGHACFVVGRSRIHGQHVDNAATISDIASGLGYEMVLREERSLAPTRKSFNLSHAAIKTETVLAFRKQR